MENIGIALGITGGILGISAFFGEWIIALFKYLYVDISVVKAEMSRIKYSARLTFKEKSRLCRANNFT